MTIMDSRSAATFAALGIRHTNTEVSHAQHHLRERRRLLRWVGLSADLSSTLPAKSVLP